ncbi:TonB family protein [bacterium]|nr:TonB family protein [bacterium]
MNSYDLLTRLDPIGYEVVRLLLSTLWQTTLFFLAVLLVDRFQRSWSPDRRHLTWLTALLAAPAIPLFNLLGIGAGKGMGSLALLPEYAFRPVAEQASHAAAHSAEPVIFLMSGPGEGSYGLATPYALLLILVGVVYLLLFSGLLWNSLRVRWWKWRSRPIASPARRERVEDLLEGERSRVQLRLTPFALVPFAHGTRKPVILLPESWLAELTNRELDQVVRHELAHVQRHDATTLLLAASARAILFFQPLAWVAASRVALLAEQACDAHVLRDRAQNIDYAKTLSRIAEQVAGRRSAMHPAPGFISSRRSFVRRIAHILHHRHDNRRPELRTLLISAVLLILAFTVAVAAPLQVRRPAPEAGNGETGTYVVPAGYPLSRVSEEAITARVGAMNDPFTGKMNDHEGIDLRAAEGTTVYATADGKVIEAGSDKGWGLFVKIEHRGGYETHYAHMSALLTEKGTQVRQGDAIGKVGSTGKSTGPHLHYAILHEDDPIDPIKIWAIAGKPAAEAGGSISNAETSAEFGTSKASGKVKESADSKPAGRSMEMGASKGVDSAEPRPKDGVYALYKYLADKQLYPEAARKSGTTGFADIRIVVSADGVVESTEVVKESPVDAGFAKAAIKAVEGVPFEPAMKDGKPVKAQYVQRFKFRLD